MTNASRDDNRVPTLIATLNTDSTVLVPIKVASSTNRLVISDASSGSDNGPSDAPRDGNRVTSLIGVSSADGVTPVVVYADSNGRLLTDST